MKARIILKKADLDRAEKLLNLQGMTRALNTQEKIELSVLTRQMIDVLRETIK